MRGCRACRVNRGSLLHHVLEQVGGAGTRAQLAFNGHPTMMGRGKAENGYRPRWFLLGWGVGRAAPRAEHLRDSGAPAVRAGGQKGCPEGPRLGGGRLGEGPGCTLEGPDTREGGRVPRRPDPESCWAVDQVMRYESVVNVQGGRWSGPSGTEPHQPREKWPIRGPRSNCGYVLGRGAYGLGLWHQGWGGPQGNGASRGQKGLGLELHADTWWDSCDKAPRISVEVG